MVVTDLRVDDAAADAAHRALADTPGQVRFTAPVSVAGCGSPIVVGAVETFASWLGTQSGAQAAGVADLTTSLRRLTGEWSDVDARMAAGMGVPE